MQDTYQEAFLKERGYDLFSGEPVCYSPDSDGRQYFPCAAAAFFYEIQKDPDLYAEIMGNILAAHMYDAAKGYYRTDSSSGGPSGRK